MCVLYGQLTTGRKSTPSLPTFANQVITLSPPQGVRGRDGGNKYVGQRKAQMYTKLYPALEGNIGVREKSVLNK